MSINCLERSERLGSETGPPIASSEARGYEDEICPPVFEITAIWLLAGSGRLGPKISPGRADFGRKFLRGGPTLAENSSGPGRLGPKIHLGPEISNTVANGVLSV